MTWSIAVFPPKLSMILWQWPFWYLSTVFSTEDNPSLSIFLPFNDVLCLEIAVISLTNGDWLGTNASAGHNQGDNGLPNAQ